MYTNSKGMRLSVPWDCLRVTEPVKNRRARMPATDECPAIDCLQVTEKGSMSCKQWEPPQVVAQATTPTSSNADKLRELGDQLVSCQLDLAACQN
jgi:hypothetical protein